MEVGQRLDDTQANDAVPLLVLPAAPPGVQAADLLESTHCGFEISVLEAEAFFVMSFVCGSDGGWGGGAEGGALTGQGAGTVCQDQDLRCVY